MASPPPFTQADANLLLDTMPRVFAANRLGIRPTTSSQIADTDFVASVLARASNCVHPIVEGKDIGKLIGVLASPAIVYLANTNTRHALDLFMYLKNLRETERAEGKEWR